MTPTETRQRGMALIAVLWLVASMSLIIGGVVRSVRSEAKVAGNQRQTSIASARADAAILLALQHLQAKPPGAQPQTVPVVFDGVTYLVHITPLNGLLDINNASVGLLADLYQYAGAADPQTARSLALSTEATRLLKNTKAMAQGFDAVPDLMTVPGMRYELYAKVVPLVTADIKSGSGRINPLAAPLALLTALASGNSVRATQFAAQRNVNPTGADRTFFKSEYIDMSPSSSLNLRVNATLPDGAAVQRGWQVYWGTDTRTGLPWRVLNVQPTRLAPLPD